MSKTSSGRPWTLGEEGDWEGMARELSEALELHPDDPAILCWLGVAEQELGLPGAAYERFKEALAQEPEDPFVLATIGNGLAQFDDPDAEAALRSASVMAPDLPLARWLFGAYLSREGLFEDALRELNAAAELAPDDPVIAYEMGVALALKGRDGTGSWIPSPGPWIWIPARVGARWSWGWSRPSWIGWRKRPGTCRREPA